MKLSKRIFSSVVIVIGFISLSCEKEESGRRETVFVDPSSNTVFNLDNQAQLNQLANTIIKKRKDAELTKDASIIDLRDSKGPYKALSIEFKMSGDLTSMIVPISEAVADDLTTLGKRKEGVTYYVTDPAGCEMTCKVVNNCSKCTQEIIEKCQSQTCTCNSVSGGCEGSITFPSN